MRNAAAPAAPPKGRNNFRPSVVSEGRNGGGAGIPILGQIAAGVPIEALQNEIGRVSAPEDLLGSGDHFALEVKGDSMIEAGIHDGDTVIIRRCDTAENGDIVVALVEGEEATLKRLRKKGSTLALEAANAEFKTRIFGPDQVDIQFEVSRPLVIGAAIASAAILAGVVGMAVQSRKRTVQAGAEQLIGGTAEVVEWSGHEGRVRVHGEIWLAESEMELASGDRVRVIGREGLKLTVKKTS